MEQDIPQSSLAVYFHIPFCLSKCHYCSFYSVPYRRTEVSEYIRLVSAETAEYLRQYPELAQADTLYFGGGTPSLLEPSQIAGLLSPFSFGADAEITLEVNPLQITPSFLEGLSQTAVNRLSIGLQSMLDTELVWLSRKHRAEQIPEKIRLVKDAGYANFSLDLMYGLPGSRVSDLDYVLDRYLELEPKHISAYLLTLDAGEQGDQQDEDLCADEYEFICGKLKAAGYIQYEISNFAQPGYESQHNLHYWKSDDYLGLGASAAGYLQGKRYTNPADIGAYRLMVEQGGIIPDPETGEHQAEDYLMMGLRLLQGIELEDFKRRFGRDIAREKRAVTERLIRLGLLRIEDGYMRLTDSALFISNAVIGEIIS